MYLKGLEAISFVSLFIESKKLTKYFSVPCFILWYDKKESEEEDGISWGKMHPYSFLMLPPTEVMCQSLAAVLGCGWEICLHAK